MSILLSIALSSTIYTVRFFCMSFGSISKSQLLLRVVRRSFENRGFLSLLSNCVSNKRNPYPGDEYFLSTKNSSILLTRLEGDYKVMNPFLGLKLTFSALPNSTIWNFLSVSVFLVTGDLCPPKISRLLGLALPI